MFEIVIIFILLAVNGLLAMSEIAFVSSKKFKLEFKAKKGSEGAKKALILLKEPEKFLSAVQVGITLIGILAGAYGGYAIAEDLSPIIAQINYLEKYANEISIAIIVTFITYLSLIIGELVPKTIALNNPERITVLTATFMYYLAKAFAPIVWFLSFSTKLLLVLTGIKKNLEPPVSEEELKSLLESGTQHGTFEKEESEMIKKIFSFNDKKVTEIMIPRVSIEWIDSSLTNEGVFRFISTHHYSKYVVAKKDIDNFQGIIYSRDFLINYINNHSFELNSVLNETLVVPESIYSIDLFERFRANKTNIALIINEYGGVEGLITLHDLIEKIVGEIPEKFEEHEQNILLREDGSYLVDGSTEITKVSELLSVDFDNAAYTTLGGFMMSRLGKIPKEGDTVKYNTYKFEIVDMDGKRVDKVLVEKLSS